MRSLGYRIVLFVMLAVGLSAGANARLQQYEFTMDWQSGPLAGQTSAGSLSFEESLAIPNAEYSQPNLLSSFDATVGTRTYGLSDVTVGFLSFDQTGELRLLGVGTDCEPNSCRSSPFQSDSFYLVYDSQSQLGNFFAVAGPPDATQSQAVGVFVQSPVPEPNALAMLCIGLVALALRRKTAASQETPFN